MTTDEKIDALNKMIEGVNEFMPSYSDGMCRILSLLYFDDVCSDDEFDCVEDLIDKIPGSMHEGGAYLWTEEYINVANEWKLMQGQYGSPYYEKQMIIDAMDIITEASNRFENK